MSELGDVIIMSTLLEKLKEEYAEDLSFEDDRVAWDKILLLSLRDLGYDLKLEDYATRIFLYKDEQCLGEVDYVVHEQDADRDKSNSFNVMFLDLSKFK